MTLADCIQIYFDQYLPHIKGASQQTIASYRQAFTLFLKFAANHCRRGAKTAPAAATTAWRPSSPWPR